MPHHCLWFLISCMALWGPLANLRIANAQSDLAKAAQAVLKERCFSCHGEGGANEGGFNYALNRRRLVPKLIVPGDPDSSLLFERVSSGQMPPEGEKLSAEEIETLRQWIADNAPAFSPELNRPFVSPADMLVAMSKDLEKANERDRPFYRYFTLTHLYNAKYEDNELESYRQGLSKLVNSLSWGREVRVPLPIDENKTIFRIDLRHYKWNETDIWSSIIAADPYHVTYADKAALSCYSMTKCDLPHVRADWFVFAASRPPLYNVILGLPDTPEQMLKFEKERLGVDVARNLQDYNDVLRAGFNGSGVSKNVRLIERHVSSYGAYWKSYDFKPNDPKEQPPKRRSLKANASGPGGPNGFEHDGGEMIFNLPNGLQGYMLTKANGEQIPKGPTDVVVDKEAVKRGRDPEVVNGVSCMNCHWSGMLNKSDQIRDHVLSQPGNFDATVVEFVTAVYAEKAVLTEKLKEDRGRFEAAVLKCGLSGLAKSEPVATLAFQFDEPLDIDLAAAEAGISIEKLTAALKRNPALGRELNSLPQGQPVPRDSFVLLYGELIKTLNVGSHHPAMSVKLTSPPGSIITNTIGMKLTLIPAGEFLMGSSPTEVANALKADAHLKEEYFKEEQPQLRVRITKPFYMGVYEVTQGEYEKVMQRNPAYFSASGSGKDEIAGIDTKRLPVEIINWFDAVEFCNTLSVADGLKPYYTLSDVVRNDDGSIKSATVTPASRVRSAPGAAGYRLPSEAQWEYAARAGTTTPFWFGSINNGKDANIEGSFPFGTLAKGDNLQRTTTVGSYRPNLFGLYDTVGNVEEWCEDRYDENAYVTRAGGTNDPVNTSKMDRRVLRGGSFRLSASNSRSAARMWDSSHRRDNNIGFRVLRTQ